MSAETIEWLQNNTRIGFTEKRGNAWHAARGVDGPAKNHFPGAIPVEEVRNLMAYPLGKGEITVTVMDLDGVHVIPHETQTAVVRLDTGDVFGIFSREGYKIHQPEEWLVDNLDLILDGGLEIAGAGLLKGGRRAFVQAELPETREAAEGVKHRPFLTAATSHDGSMSTTYLTGTTVVVCDNTLSTALGEKGTGKVKIRHSRNSLNRVSEVRQNLGLVVEQAGDEFDAQVEALTSRYVSDSQWQAFLNEMILPKGKDLEGRSKTMADNKMAELNRYWNYDERVAPWKNNAYGVLAAVNTYSHHSMSVKGATRAERNLDRMIGGEFDKLDRNTLALLDHVTR